MESIQTLHNINFNFEEPDENSGQHCCNSNDTRVTELIGQCKGLYNCDKMGLTPLLNAIQSREKAVANYFLDIYERDLDFLNGRSFKRALVAMMEDQTEEFWRAVKHGEDDDCIPVLIKVSRLETRKCVYLRKKLNHINDSSLRLARKLEDKNGFCDINFQIIGYNHGSALHFALAKQMAEIVLRLLQMPTIDKNLINPQGDSPLSFAILHKNIELVKAISTDPKDFEESLIIYALRSRNPDMIEHVIKKMVESERFSLKEIVRMRFDHSNGFRPFNRLLHEIATRNFYKYFMRHELPLDEDDFCVVNDNGDTVLHLLLRDHAVKSLGTKTKITKFLMQKYLKLLTIQNSSGCLPLHDAVVHCGDHYLIRKLLEKTFQATGNKNIFYADANIALKCLQDASKFYLPSNNEVEFMLQQLFNGKWHEFLKDESLPLLHNSLMKMYFDHLRNLEFLLSQTKVTFDLSECFNGFNAYLLVWDGVVKYHSMHTAMRAYMMLLAYQPVEDFNAASPEGKTLLMYLCEFCEDNDYTRPAFAQDPSCATRKTRDGLTCLHFVHDNSQNIEIIHLLLQNGADPTAENESGERPIAQAIRYGNENMFNILFPFENDINYKDGRNGETLIHLAIRSENFTIIEQILEKRPDLTITDNLGNTPLHGIHAKKNYQTVLEFIIARKLPFDFNMKNYWGDTPLLMAIAADVTNK